MVENPGPSRRGDNPSQNGRPGKCDLYLPGHNVHWIQVRREYESDIPATWGKFTGLDDDVITVEFLDRIERYRNHRPEDIRQVAQLGDQVRVAYRFRLLTFYREGEHLMTYCIDDADNRSIPCRAVAPVQSAEDLADRLEDAGGFVISGSDLGRLLGKSE